MDELDRRRRQRLLEIAPIFNNDVPSASDLLDELPCISSKSTRDKIKKMERYESNADANRKLCSSLTGRTRWYEQLLAGLEKVDCGEIAEMMRADSRGSLCSVQASAPLPSAVECRQDAFPSTVDVPQRHDANVISVSMNTTVNHWPIGVKRALSVLDLPNEGGLSNNWETLADVTWEESNRLERCDSPSAKIIEAWHEKHPNHATLGNLLRMLEGMDRLDVISQIRKVVGWENERAADDICPEQGRDKIYCSLEKPPQYNNNLFDDDNPGSNMEEPRTTRSLPLDLKDQHKKFAMFNSEHALQGSNFRDGDQLWKKIKNQPLDCPGTSAMASSSQDKSNKRQINNQDFSGKEVAGLPRETKEAPTLERCREDTRPAGGCREDTRPAEGCREDTQPADDFEKKELPGMVEYQNAKLTEEANQDVQKKMNKLPATDKNLPLDWPKDGEKMDRRDPSDSLRESQGKHNGERVSSNQTGKLFGSEPLVRRKAASGFQSSKVDGSEEKTQQMPIPQEKDKVNVERRKEISDNRPKTAKPSKTTHRGEVSIQDKICQVVDGQNDFQTRHPECQPVERTSDPNIMTADSRQETESNNYSPSKEKQMYLRKKQIVKELGLPSQVVLVPSQNSVEGIQHDMSDSPAHTLASTETINVSSSDIQESLEDPSHTAGESAKSTRVAEDKEQLAGISCPPRFLGDNSPVAVGKVNMLPSPNVREKKSQESLHPDTKNADVKGTGGAKKQVLPSSSDCHLNGEETCNKWDREEVQKGYHADKPQKMEQRKENWEGRVEMKDDSKGIHGDSKKIRKLEDSTDAEDGRSVKSPSTSKEENVLITHDFTNHIVGISQIEMGQRMTKPVGAVGYQDTDNLDQNAEVALGNVSKNLLTSKDFTMLEQKPAEESRGKLEDDPVVRDGEGGQQTDNSKGDKMGGNDGAHTLPSLSGSQKMGESSASPLPLQSQEPDERERSADSSNWGHSLVKGMASSLLRNLFGNNLSSS